MDHQEAVWSSRHPPKCSVKLSYREIIPGPMKIFSSSQTYKLAPNFSLNMLFLIWQNWQGRWPVFGNFHSKQASYSLWKTSGRVSIWICFKWWFPLHHHTSTKTWDWSTSWSHVRSVGGCGKMEQSWPLSMHAPRAHAFCCPGQLTCHCLQLLLFLVLPSSCSFLRIFQPCFIL